MTTTIVFDLDGTLADSSDCIVGAAHHVCRTFDLIPVPDEKIKAKIGQPLGQMLSTLFQNAIGSYGGFNACLLT